MPFSKVGEDDYKSPSGRHFDEAQVKLWYAHGGKFPGQKGPGEAPAHQERTHEATHGKSL